MSYIFTFPDGKSIKASKLNVHTIEILKEQCAPLEIDGIKSKTGEFFKLKENEFENSTAIKPPPLSFKVILQASFFLDKEEECLCGSTLKWLGSNDSEKNAAKSLGSNMQLYQTTKSNSYLKLSVLVAFNTIIVTLNYDDHIEKILNIQPTTNISINDYNGKISGQLLTLAQLVPYSLIEKLFDKVQIKQVIFTGSGWSGSIAHICCILFRSHLIETATNYGCCKCISFNGPLCGTFGLQQYLLQHKFNLLHITINHNHNILDRLIVDFQLCSLLKESKFCENKTSQIVVNSLCAFLSQYYVRNGGGAWEDANMNTSMNIGDVHADGTETRTQAVDAKPDVVNRDTSVDIVAGAADVVKKNTTIEQVNRSVVRNDNSLRDTEWIMAHYVINHDDVRTQESGKSALILGTDAKIAHEFCPIGVYVFTSSNDMDTKVSVDMFCDDVSDVSGGKTSQSDGDVGINIDGGGLKRRGRDECLLQGVAIHCDSIRKCINWGDHLLDIRNRYQIELQKEHDWKSYQQKVHFMDPISLHSSSSLAGNMDNSPITNIFKSSFSSSSTIDISFTPVLTELTIVSTSRRLILNFAGRNLSPLLWRLYSSDMSLVIPNGRMSNSSTSSTNTLPFAFDENKTTYELTSSDPKLEYISSSDDKAVLILSGIQFTSDVISICLRSDFGESNFISVLISDVTSTDDATGLQLLHPTMNSEFLSEGYLRIALFCRSYLRCEDPMQEAVAVAKSSSAGDTNSLTSILKEKDANLHHLWIFLLDIERLYQKQSSNTYQCVLEIYMEKFLEDVIDICVLRSVTIKVFIDIAQFATQQFSQSENPVLLGTRKVLGGIGRLGGGIVSLAGAIISLPAVALALPVANSLQRSVATHQSISVGMGAYAGLVGLVGAPGMIVSGIGRLISYAGQRAMKDPITLQYKVLLKTLIELLGANARQVIDETSPLEDYLILQFGKQFPDVTLSECAVDEIFSAIDKQSQILRSTHSKLTDQEEKIILLRQFIDQIPVIPDKIYLVSRIQSIRKILQHNVVLSFIGIHNSGKSTILNRLFDINTNSHLLHPTDTPTSFPLGRWIEKLMEENNHRYGELKDYMNEKKRSQLQLYAVDFPGVTSERNVRSSSTEYCAELSSIFVIILRCGHVTELEKQVIGIAKSACKPYIVLVNQCDVIKEELNTPGNYDKTLQSYARQLDISDTLIHFMSAFDDYCIDKLRGMLYGMIQNLLEDADQCRTLALRMIPARIVDEIKLFAIEEKNTIAVCDGSESLAPTVLSDPSALGIAVQSLMFNLRPLSIASIRDAYTLATFQTNNDITKEIHSPKEDTLVQTRASTHDISKFQVSIRNQICQVACKLEIENEIYTVLLDLYDSRYKHHQDTWQKVESANLQLLQQMRGSQFLEYAIGTSTLKSLYTQIEHFYNHSNIINVSSTINISNIIADILLTLGSIYTMWKVKGYDAIVIVRALKKMFENFDDNDDYMSNTNNLPGSRHSTTTKNRFDCHDEEAKFLEIITKLETVYQVKTKMMISRFVNESESGTGATDINTMTSYLDENGKHDVLCYELAKEQLQQLNESVTFQPFADLLPLPSSVSRSDTSNISSTFLQGTESCLKIFQNKIKDENQNRYDSIQLRVSNSSAVLVEVLDQLLLLTTEQLEHGNFRFVIDSESAIDVNGVTRSVLTKAAQEINENPKLVHLTKDEESNMVYFDPNACASSDPVFKEKVFNRYLALGRLLGLCLTKSNSGITMPANFSLAMYKLILGHRLGISDLSITNPQIAMSLHSVCLLDAETLVDTDLSFNVNLDDQSEYDLVPHGSKKRVNNDNKLDYIKEIVKYYLCLSNGSTSEGEGLTAIPDANTDLNNWTMGECMTCDNLSPSVLKCQILAIRQCLFGIQQVCTRDCFNFLPPAALQLILEGNRNIDTLEWRTQTDARYMGVDALNGRIVESMFWEMVNALSDADKRKLLSFSTGTSTIPGGGFKCLNPKFTLIINNTLSCNDLPTSHTCFHMLICPKYANKDIMQEKFLKAIQETDTAQLGMV